MKKRLATSHPESVSQLIEAARGGDSEAEARLFGTVYRELHRLARTQLAKERAGITLQTTALVHEAYLRLAGNSWKQGWEGRQHFFWAAAESMRRILVDHARRRGALKRGGGRSRTDLEVAEVVSDEAERDDAMTLSVDEAIRGLESLDPRKAVVVKLRYFVGMTVDETAQALDLSPRTVKSEWRVARLWLRREIASLAERK